ncbi:hypothetical protein ACFL43_02725 [Thermodesulfobacteriota bacterium]
MKKTTTSLVGLLLFFFLCSVAFNALCFRTKREYERATLQMLTDFSAQKPFQFRILMPLAARTVRGAVPAVPLKIIYIVLNTLGTFLLLIAFWRYLLLFFDRQAAAPGALLILYPLLWNYGAFGNLYYPSDIPAVLFFTLGLMAIYKKRMDLFYLVFIAATFNRETSCFLTPVFVLFGLGRIRLPKLAGHFLLQLGIWVGVKWFLDMVFQGNGGSGLYENHFSQNLYHILHPLACWDYVVQILLASGAVWLFIPFGWREQPRFFKQAMAVVVLFYAGMLVAGNLHETRIYNELIPVLTAPAVVGLKKIGQRL